MSSDEQQRSDGGDSSTAASSSPAWERQTIEKLLLATLREQRAARRWKIAFRLIGIVLAVFFLWELAGYEGLSTSSTEGRHTALVRLEGPIDAHSTASAEAVVEGLDAAFDDKNAVGVILKINSPGGSAVQAGIINAEIRRLRRDHPDKPIHVVVDDICASGGYYVAVAADRIYVDRASIIGSIGVRMDSFGFNRLLDRFGVERRLYTAGANKGMLDPFSPVRPQQRAYLQQMLDEIHRQFIAAVREGRGTRLKETPQTFSGLFWTGEQGVKLGLADGFGTVDTVARNVIGAEDLVDYTVKENVAERLARRFGTAFGAGLGNVLLRSGVAPVQ